jgi:transglutaminase-like putative cysteine protease
MFLEIEHRLTLRYDGFIRESFIELRLQPKTNARQSLASFVLAAGPPTRVHRYRDWNDNLVHHLAITKFHDRIEVHARSVVDTSPPGDSDRPSGPGPTPSTTRRRSRLSPPTCTTSCCSAAPSPRRPACGPSPPR